MEIFFLKCTLYIMFIFQWYIGYAPLYFIFFVITICYFVFSDYIINEAAKILRLIHIKNLRDLQTQINSAIVGVQALIANPKTDSRLGKVGFWTYSAIKWTVNWTQMERIKKSSLRCVFPAKLWDLSSASSTYDIISCRLFYSAIQVFQTVISCS